jgi:hypothetical protein
MKRKNEKLLVGGSKKKMKNKIHKTFFYTSNLFNAAI